MTDLFGMEQNAEDTDTRTHFDRLVEAFHDAALFLIERMKRDRWHWSSNYLREHTRCATGLQFSNSLSPKILRAVRARYPELKPYIDIGTLKK